MRSWLLVCGILISSSSSLCLAQHGKAQHAGWHSEYSQATAAADRDGLPVLLHFHAWYCGPCQRMDRDVFPDGEVQRALGNGLSAVQIDVTQAPDVASQFAASTVPRDVVVYQDGTVQTLNVGYMSKASYLSMLREIVAQGTIRKKKEVPVPTPVEPGGKPEQEPVAVVEKDPAPVEVKTLELTKPEAQILGLEGFCPVRLHDKREWVPGLSTITAEHRDIRYQFASEAARDIFLQNPADYAPQDLGCDPVVLTADSKAITGSIRFGAFFDKRLYLFRSPENRDQFKQNPLKYVHIRSALKVDQMEGTRYQ